MHIKFKRHLERALILSAVLAGTGLGAGYVAASDHDDGTTDMKTQNTNLTDLYVFKESTENPGVSGDDLIFIMNSNPRSLARQQYYFNTRARYEFHVSRVSDNDDVPSGANDVILRFEFEAPDDSGHQAITVTKVADGDSFEASETDGGDPISTTLLDETPNNQSVTLDGQTLTVFAGLREDPFFFDVEQYFRVRAGFAGTGPAVTFRDPDSAVDFTAGYNVNAIVVRVPRAFLTGSGNATSFDVWETISVRN